MRIHEHPQGEQNGGGEQLLYDSLLEAVVHYHTLELSHLTLAAAAEWATNSQKPTSRPGLLQRLVRRLWLQPLRRTTKCRTTPTRPAPRHPPVARRWMTSTVLMFAMLGRLSPMARKKSPKPPPIAAASKGLRRGRSSGVMVMDASPWRILPAWARSLPT